MSDPKSQSLTFRVLHSQIFRWTFLVLTVTFSFISIISMMSGLFQTGSQLAALAAAFATILLVSLTAQYAVLTRELVKESERSRTQRKEERRNEQKREVRALRRAFRQEIEAIENLSEYANEYHVSRSVAPLNAPTTIYRTNAGKIGILSDEEVEYIVEYYTHVDHIEEMLRLQRKMDTTFEMDILTENFERGRAIVDQVIRLISFGRFGKRGTEEREEYIQEQLEELADIQNTALSALEKNLEDG